MYKVLLVDDEYMILAGLKVLVNWEEFGFEVVHTSRNAKDALTFLTEQEVDLLMTDITMP